MPRSAGTSPASPLSSRGRSDSLSDVAEEVSEWVGDTGALEECPRCQGVITRPTSHDAQEPSMSVQGVKVSSPVPHPEPEP